MKRKTIVLHGRRVTKAALALLIGTVMMQSCKDDDLILTGQPSWLGNSIYERLQEEGNYKYTLRLIDDLGQTEVLGHTGSKSLFVANDSAFEAWFAENNLSYDKLSRARKKLMLNNSMIDNAYLLSLMSNVSGNPPVTGRAMRRETSGSAYDSVYVMAPSEMPNTFAWEELREAGDSIYILKDGTVAPMIHFLPAFMQYNKLTNSDLSVLTNHQATSIEESWINGKKVIESDITCKNGYIHRVNGVVTAAPNMAEIMRQNEKMSIWSRLVDKFSVPVFSQVATDAYNRVRKEEGLEPISKLYILRYYNEEAGENTRLMADGTKVDPKLVKLAKDTVEQATLAFDPAWNQYIYNNTMGYDLHYDAGAMIVPTDSAIMEWWSGKDGRGKDLRDEYKELDSIPQLALSKLINVNMLSVFTEAVPSKFDHVLNDAKEWLGITPEDVEACYMGCNGVIYLVKKVFPPAEYASVIYPALAHESLMDVYYQAVDKRNFQPYLLSMESNYALVMPTNDAMMTYLDPSSYGTVHSDGISEQPDVIEFYYKNGIKARRYPVKIEADGSFTKVNTEPTETDFGEGVLNSMLDDMIDQFIIVLEKDQTIEKLMAPPYNYHFFKSKGGALIYAEMGTNGKPVFAGGWQLEHGKQLLPSSEVYPKENGRSYQFDTQMPLGAQSSLRMTLKAHSEYSEFLSLMENDYINLFIDKLSSKYTPANAGAGNRNFKLFDNYNYTVFIPQNSAIRTLQDNGTLPKASELVYGSKFKTVDSLIVAENWVDATTWSKMSDANKGKLRDSVKTAVASVVENFVRYHVQDRSVAIGMAPEPGLQGNAYESMLRNPETGRFYQLTTDYDSNNMTVTDVLGNVCNVVKTDGLYNNICREYWFENKGNAKLPQYRLFMSSDAVVHLIDQPLKVNATPKPWRQVVKDYLNR